MTICRGMMTPEQCRAARALLHWTQADLAERSGIGHSTVRNFENGRHALMRSNMVMLRSALEAAGVIFIDAGAQGPGVRLRDRPPEGDSRPPGRRRLA